MRRQSTQKHFRVRNACRVFTWAFIFFCDTSIWIQFSFSPENTKQLPIVPSLSSGVGTMIYAGGIGTQIANELIDSHRCIVYILGDRRGGSVFRPIVLTWVDAAARWGTVHQVGIGFKWGQKNIQISCCVPTCSETGLTPPLRAEPPVHLARPQRNVHWSPRKPASVWVSSLPKLTPYFYTCGAYLVFSPCFVSFSGRRFDSNARPWSLYGNIQLTFVSLCCCCVVFTVYANQPSCSTVQIQVAVGCCGDANTSCGSNLKAQMEIGEKANYSLRVFWRHSRSPLKIPFIRNHSCLWIHIAWNHS